MNTSTVTFCGGAGSVTGSNFLLESGSEKFLIDCGLFQGQHTVEDANWEPFSFDPSSISFLINTHAHIDHIGRIPKLVKDGFRGRIISTEATKALAEPMLLDAMEILRKTAQKTGKEPLYEEGDIKQALSQWEGIPYHDKKELPGGFTLELFDAGHILGSAIAVFSRAERSMAFTGDLGGGNSPLLSPNEVPQGLNYLLMESVYGDKMRDDDKRVDVLEDLIEDTVSKGGTLLIPAFSTERTQDVLYEIRSLMLQGRIPKVPVFLDSPLAEKITTAYLAYPRYFSAEMQKRIADGEQLFSFPELRFIHSTEESRAITQTQGAKIILAGSGMSNGGRVVSHERDVLGDPKSTLLIVGYQVPGSLGRQLVEGVKTVTIKGQKISVKAKVQAMYGYSAHMNGEQLLEFVNKAGDGIEEVFVVMGEPASSSFLAQRIQDYLGVKAITPEKDARVEIQL